MAELLYSPDTMRKVKRELRDVLGAKTEVQESDIAHVPYLQAVVKEVLRLHPPVSLTFYRAEATVEIQGYQIPEGTTIILNIYGQFIEIKTVGKIQKNFSLKDLSTEKLISRGKIVSSFHLEVDAAFAPDYLWHIAQSI